MDKKREGTEIDRAACVWMALSIPTHRVGAENAKNAACDTETKETKSRFEVDMCIIGDLMSQVTNGFSFADRARLAMAKESAQRVEELHNAQMALVSAHVEYMHTRIKSMNV